MPTTTPAAQQLTFQGLVVPGSALNPKEFFRRTRRQEVLYKTISTWAGFGDTDTIPVLRSGVLSFLTVKIKGTLVVALDGGTCATTSAWPYGLVSKARFQANGQSNLVNADGWHLRLREFARNEKLTDRGVNEYVGGSAPGTILSQGTFALSSESWGVGSGVTGIASGSYDVEFSVKIPVSYEERTLIGAIFLQTTSTTCELDIDWASVASLFTLTGSASVTFNPTVVIEAEAFTIPKDGKGGFFLPNLSNFHSFIQTKFNGQISDGLNEITISGQGVGRKLMGLFWRTFSNGAPVIPTSATVTQPYWRYGTNETPETWVDGASLAIENERNYGVDIASVQGFEAIDFDKINAFRDSVDEGSATEIRFGYTLVGDLTGPYAEYSQDILMAGAAA